MYWKNLIFLLLVVPQMLYARDYAGRKTVLLRKSLLLNSQELKDYVQKFLDQNPSAQEHLSVASDETLQEWASALAGKIEERYSIMASSTLIHRFEYHEMKISKILKHLRKKEQNIKLQEPIHTMDYPEPSIDTTSLRFLLNKNKEDTKNYEKIIQNIEHRMKYLNNANEEEKTALEKDLIFIIETLKNQYQDILKAFAGIPHTRVRQKLDEKWHILSQKDQAMNHYLTALLRHSQRLKTLNQSMSQKLNTVFSDTHLGITPYKDKAMGLKYELMSKALRELEEMRSKLSEKNKVLFDSLCRILAVNLWMHWVPALKAISGKTEGKTERVEKKSLENMALSTADLASMQPAGNTSTPQSRPKNPSPESSTSDSSLLATSNKNFVPELIQESQKESVGSIPLHTEKTASVDSTAKITAAAQSSELDEKSSLHHDALSTANIPEDFLALLSLPLDQPGVLEKLLSPLQANLILSKAELDISCEKILNLLRIVQKQFQTNGVYDSLMKQTSELWEKMSKWIKSWGKKESLIQQTPSPQTAKSIQSEQPSFSEKFEKEKSIPNSVYKTYKTNSVHKNVNATDQDAQQSANTNTNPLEESTQPSQ